MYVIMEYVVLYNDNTCRKGIVVQESVEGFREHLAKLQDMKGLTSEEKGFNY